jgi:hypothetical protein
MDESKQKLIDECRRQEDSCLYTSTALFEWVKALRVWRFIFIVGPIILGGVVAWPFLQEQPRYQWGTAVCGLLAGIAPAIYKALDLDRSLPGIAKHANTFKILQDRFRQARHMASLGPPDEFAKEFNALMVRMDRSRSSSLIPPERFFRKARRKIHRGHYDFAVDTESVRSQAE